jgi:transcriptional regulator with XRE-family HTH domain
MDLFEGELDRNMPLLSADAVGRALRSAREQLGFSLADVARETRMAERHLEAIEQARYDGFRLPAWRDRRLLRQSRALRSRLDGRGAAARPLVGFFSVAESQLCRNRLWTINHA